MSKVDEVSSLAATAANAERNAILDMLRGRRKAHEALAQVYGVVSSGYEINTECALTIDSLIREIEKRGADDQSNPDDAT